jgi:hypothetical protein
VKVMIMRTDAVLNEVFRWGHIEVLLTSVSIDGRPNTAPMGVDRVRANEVILRIYRDTDTFRNIALGNRWLVLTLSTDAMDYYQSLFGEIEYETVPGWPIPSPVTKCRYPLFLARVSSLTDDDPSTIRAEIVDYSFLPSLKSCRQAYSRANAALIEALIYYTKLEALVGSATQAVICRLYDKLKANALLVKRLGSEQLKNAADNVINFASEQLRKAGDSCRG